MNENTENTPEVAPIEVASEATSAEPTSTPEPTRETSNDVSSAEEGTTTASPVDQGPVTSEVAPSESAEASETPAQ